MGGAVAIFLLLGERNRSRLALSVWRAGSPNLCGFRAVITVPRDVAPLLSWQSAQSALRYQMFRP
jgi:hypothetical protein